jgi:glycosyltransferase involved in cell wall biosynthesis
MFLVALPTILKRPLIKLRDRLRLDGIKRAATVFNVYNRPEPRPRALLHYKTEPIYDPRVASQYRHTNSWEILELTRILDDLGFTVDVVDRVERKWLPSDRYNVVIGNASGNSGQRYPEYCAATPSAKHVFYGTGPHPVEANRLVIERYDALEDRTGVKGKPMRVMDKVNMPACMANTDAILTIDGNGFTRSTYEPEGKPIETFTSSTSPELAFDRNWLESRRLDSFLCFAGNGFIAKGVDLAVEAFLESPELRLTVAGPGDDRAFWHVYGERIKKAPNIDYVGFLDVAGPVYAELVKTHAWSLLPSTAEGLCTSVATTMRSGLVPVVTHETSVATGDFGVLLPSDPVEINNGLPQTIKALSKTNISEYRQRAISSAEASNAYTQQAFQNSIRQAFDVLL